MPRREYRINKGINAPLEFKGLKGQYIAYLGLGLVGVLLLFVLLYLCGLNTFICLGIAAVLGGWLFYWVYTTSAKYGPDGMMKKAARRWLPSAIRSRSRTGFYKMDKKKANKQQQNN